jgi:hypothetical protein
MRKTVSSSQNGMSKICLVKTNIQVLEYLIYEIQVSVNYILEFILVIIRHKN